jgi:LDH2 family malate/lactate/ureidoglycolate dehydrogenase
VNQPPNDFIRVSHDALFDFVVAVSRAAGLAGERADLLARLLVENDLRGVFSHGTTQIATYARLMRDGRLNPRPDVRVVKETGVSLDVDGDGGLGYFPCHDGTKLLVDKAEQSGIAVLLTRNHGHFGAAGIYARMTLGHDLLCYVTSGHQLLLKPGRPIYAAAGGSPMAFTAPTESEPPIVLDFGAMHDLYGPPRDELAALAPGLVLRSIGLGEICQAWGGLLSGLRIEPEPPRWTWPGANQGSLIIAFRIDLFGEPAAFRREMDAYVRQVRQLEPLPGFERSLMPGGLETIREREYRADGIPVGAKHRGRLEELAAEFGVGVPW